MELSAICLGELHETGGLSATLAVIGGTVGDVFLGAELHETGGLSATLAVIG